MFNFHRSNCCKLFQLIVKLKTFEWQKITTFWKEEVGEEHGNHGKRDYTFAQCRKLWRTLQTRISQFKLHKKLSYYLRSDPHKTTCIYSPDYHYRHPRFAYTFGFKNFLPRTFFNDDKERSTWNSKQRKEKVVKKNQKFFFFIEVIFCRLE